MGWEGITIWSKSEDLPGTVINCKLSGLKAEDG